jgi:hypothetical protein
MLDNLRVDLSGVLHCLDTRTKLALGKFSDGRTKQIFIF